jgi:hypothetical protein
LLLEPGNSPFFQLKKRSLLYIISLILYNVGGGIMKKLTKKVVIATSAGLASMILNAACGYGPPVEYEPNGGATTEPVIEDNAVNEATDQASSTEAVSESSVEVSIEGSSEEVNNSSESVSFEEVPSDAASILDSLDDLLVEPDDDPNYKIDIVPAVYGPPPAGH